MKLAERSPREDKIAKGFKAPHSRDSRQLFTEIIGVALAIFRRVEDAVDIIKEILFAYLFARISRLKMS